ncbi:hypothetical protein Tco_1025330 [Tanacetum coccineum]
MTTLPFADTDNLVAFLDKPAESEGFKQIVDFLNASSLRYDLTVNPTIYTSCIQQFWATAKVKTINGEVQLQALVDGTKVIITETSHDGSRSGRNGFLANPTYSHHTPIITQPSTSKPQKKQKPRKPKRKDTEIPQFNGPTVPIADEAANEENVNTHSNDPLLSGDFKFEVESQEVREERRVKNSQA